MKPKHIKIKNKVISNSNIEQKILNKIDKYDKCFDRDDYPIQYLIFEDCDIKNLDFALNNYLKKSIAEYNKLVYILFYHCHIQHLAISNDNDEIEFCFNGCEIDNIKFIPFFDWSDYKHKNSVFDAIRFITCEIRGLIISNSSITTSLNIVNSNVSYGCLDDGCDKNVIINNKIKNLIILNTTMKYITIDQNEMDRFVMKRVSILNEINKPTSSIKCDWDKLTLLEENDIDNRCLNDDWCFKVTKLNTEKEEAGKRYYYYFPKADKIFSNYSSENYACTKGYLILYTKYISLDEFSTKINCYAKHTDASDFTLKQYNALYDYFYKIREIFKD